MGLGLQHQKPMMDAISNVLGTMFYIAPVFERIGDGDFAPSLSLYLESNIKIFGESECIELFFRTTERFARIVTANFLGVGEGEVVVEQMADTLKEMANIVAGDFLARQENAKRELGVPSFKQLRAEDKGSPNRKSIAVWLSYDDEPMAVVFSVCEG